jgi:ribulose-5-phosphate 4-epimerase/fuculose-1-phosphate aldolase
MQLGKVRLLPYFIPGSTEIGDAITGLAGKHAAVMLAHHGPVISAKTLEAAVYAAEELEATAKLAYLTRLLEPNALSDEQVRTLVRQYAVEWD